MIVPIATPLGADGEPDLAALGRLAKWQIREGIDVLFALGTTGEFYGFNVAWQRRIVETVCEAAAGRVPVIAGVSGHSTPAAVETLRELRQSSVAGFVSSTPYFMSYSQDELAGHFQALAEAGGSPVILYNYPGRYRHRIDIPTVRLLLEQGAAYAIKDTDGDFDYLLQLLELKRRFPEFLVFEGALQNLARSGKLGIDGSVQAIGNLWPEVCASLWRYIRSEEWELLEAESARLWKFHREIETVLVFIRALKGCMSLRGVSSALPVAPMRPAGAGALDRLRALMDEAYPRWRSA